MSWEKMGQNCSGLKQTKIKSKLIYSNIGYNDKYQIHDVFIINKEIDIKNITIQKEQLQVFK